MIGHVGFYVDDLQKNDAFYRPLLKTVDYEVVLTLPQCIGYGTNGIPFFEIYTGKSTSTGLHIALLAKDKESVDRFHAVGLSLGGTDNGKPGYRDYVPNYYAAFIIDPNGHNLEAFIILPD